MAKILVVDDSQVFRDQIANILKEAAFEPVHAGNGQEGIEVVKQNPDIILALVDYHMPVMDGLEMIANVRKIPGKESLPIFMLTTKSSPELKKTAKELSVLAWIMKPVDGKSLVSAIKHVLKTP